MKAKRLIAVLLVLILTTSSFICVEGKELTSSEANYRSTYTYSVKDATVCQKKVAQLNATCGGVTFNDAIHDANGDSKITIVDATLIQKQVARYYERDESQDLCKYFSDPGFNKWEYMTFNYLKECRLKKPAILAIMAYIWATCDFEDEDVSPFRSRYMMDSEGYLMENGGICGWTSSLTEPNNSFTLFTRDCPEWNSSDHDAAFAAQVEYLWNSLKNNGKGTPETKYYRNCKGCLSKLRSAPYTKEGAYDALESFGKMYMKYEYTLIYDMRIHNGQDYIDRHWDCIV